MGCVFSSSQLRVGRPGLYRVFNVDDQGRAVSEGFIDIADSELILYQNGKEPIRWPLRCLRRYGYEGELFSFESGRRCPTGPGIYAFTCTRAESLFTNLQDSILRSGHDDSSRYNASNTLLNPVRNSTPNQQNYTLLTTNCTTGTNTFPETTTASPPSHPYINGDIHSLPSMITSNIVELPDHDYENAEIGCERVQRMPDSFDQIPYENIPDAGEIAYCNINLDNGPTRPLRAVHNHTYDVDGAGAAITRVNGTGSRRGSASIAEAYQPVNYIQLDMDRRESDTSTTIPRSSPISPVSFTFPSPATPGLDTGPREQYADIDFKATKALSQSAHVKVDEGQRRTRHSSNIVGDSMVKTDGKKNGLGVDRRLS